MGTTSFFMLVTTLFVCYSQVDGQCQVVKDAAYWAEASEDEIVVASTWGNKIGSCNIQDNPVSADFCDLYAKSAFIGADGDRGWPKNRYNRGTGCVRAPDLSKGVTTCFYSRSEYDLSSSQVDTFCTEIGFSNAVAQIRHAIANDGCKLSSIPEECTPGDRGCVCSGSNTGREKLASL